MGAAKEAAKHHLPTSLLDAMTALYADMQQTANQKLREIEEASKIVCEKAESDLGAERQRANTLEIELEAVVREKQELTDFLAALQSEKNDLTHALDIAQVRLEENDKANTGLQQQNSSLQQNLEHFHQSAHQQLEDMKHEQHQAMDASRRDLVAMRNENKALQTQIDDGRRATAGYKQKLELTQDKIERFDDQVLQLQSEVHAVKTQLKSTHSQLESTLSENNQLLQQVSMIQPQADTAKSLEEKMVLLEQQYHEALQEKSVLQGECRQLEKILKKWTDQRP